MSPRLALDFVPTAYFAWRRLTLLGALALLVGLLTASYMWQQYQSKQALYQRLAEQVQSAKPVKKHRPAPITATVVSTAQSTELSTAIHRLNAPWSNLLQAIEQAKMRDVALLSLVPDDQQQQLVMKGEAKHMQAALDYIEALEALPMLTRVTLQQHQVDETHPLKPVRFTIVGHWE